MDDQQPSRHIVTQQLAREIATQVIRKQMLGIAGGAADIIGACRAHPVFMQLPMEDRDLLIDAVFDATESAHITITWNDTVVAVVGKGDGSQTTTYPAKVD